MLVGFIAVCVRELIVLLLQQCLVDRETYKVSNVVRRGGFCIPEILVCKFEISELASLMILSIALLK